MDTWITRSGKLVTTKYDDAFPHGDFCVDRTSSGDLVAVMCNPCSEKVKECTQGVKKYKVSVLVAVYPSVLPPWPSVYDQPRL